MGKKNKIKQSKISNTPRQTSVIKPGREKKRSFWPWLFLVIGITAVCFLPMLGNGFTNWDDEYYVVKNEMLQGPDWHAIFTQTVVANYHPLTMITLALNYQLTGLDPSSYLLTNFLLHLTNTGLVFYFIWLISGRKTWVAFFTALIFGIHPMHVESVAWVTERKDVLYTFFLLLSLLQYWRYIEKGKSKNLWICFLFFALSLLSKPAAIILPLVLFLMDYWKDRKLSWKTFFEKIPFLVAALAFAFITLKIQTPVAVAGTDQYPLWTRPLFASYTMMIYFIRFFIPYPLAAFHPFPSPEHLEWPFFVAPFFMIALLAFLWVQRKNKIVVFGFFFFLINLLLVSQIISIGFTIVSERYTYVPYIGIAFMLGMWLTQNKIRFSKQVFWAVLVVSVFVFGFMTFQRTKIWENSGNLWTDVIKYYPNAPMPRTNRAGYYSVRAQTPGHEKEKDSLYKQAIEDCNIALKNKPEQSAAYEKRGLVFLELGRNLEARSDGDSLQKYAPKNKLGYEIAGIARVRLNEPEKAVEDFNKCLSFFPDYHRVIKNRGDLLVTFYKKYNEALADYNRAIELSPLGDYYVSRSMCYYNLGNKEKAKEDAQAALQKGAKLPESFRKLLNL